MNTRTLFIALSVAVICLGTSIIAQNSIKAEPTLKEQIEARSSKSKTNQDPVKKKAYADGIAAVAESGVVEKATKIGDAAPDFTLSNATGESVTLSEELKNGPVVLTWYRGGWCPYCNIQLGAYQAVLPEIKELGGTLIALTPELPDKTLSTKEKNSLEFEVLSDVNQKIAKEYGLVFKLTPEVAEYYRKGFDLNSYNGKDAAADELPLAATYVIDTDGKIAYSFLSANYKERAEPIDILEALAALKK